MKRCSGKAVGNIKKHNPNKNIVLIIVYDIRKKCFQTGHKFHLQKFQILSIRKWKMFSQFKMLSPCACFLLFFLARLLLKVKRTKTGQY